MPSNFRPDTGWCPSTADRLELDPLLKASPELGAGMTSGTDPGRVYFVLAMSLIILRHHAQAAGIDYQAAAATAAAWFDAESAAPPTATGPT